MPFVKGQSGNPSGRPPLRPGERAAADLAREHTPRAVARLAELLEDSDGRVAVRAAEILLNRAWGNPTQPVTAETKDGEDLGAALIAAVAELRRLNE